MADKLSPLSRISTALIPTEDEDVGMTQSRQGYIDAQRKLIEAFENRNQLFDPTLLAMAQGFLAPTRSGTFGESLSNVTGAVAPVAEREQKRGQELAQMKFELAAAELGQRQEAKTQQEFKKLLGGLPTASTGEQPSSSDEAFAAMKNLPSDQAIATLALTDPARAKILSDMKKSIMERFKVTERGVFDVEKGRFTPRPGGPVTPIYIPELGGSLPLTERDQVELDAARRSGNNEEVYKIIERLTSALPRPGQPPTAAPGATPAAPGVTPAVPAVSQAPAAQLPDQKPEPPQLQTTVNGRIPITDQQKEQLKQINDRLIEDYKSRLAIWQRGQEELGVGAAKRTGAAIEAGTIATAKEQVAKEIQQLIGTEGMNQYFGAFNKPNDIFSAIVLSVARAQESKSEGVDRSQIERVVSNLTLNLPKSPNETMEQFNERKKQVIERATMAASRIAEMELYYSQLIKGQGQITEGEREILRRAAINPRYDSPRVILAKAKAIEAIASFEKWRANTLEENGITLAQLKRDPKYKFQEMENARIKAVNDALKPLLPKSQQQRPTSSGGLTMDAINQRARDLGLKP